VRAALFRHVVAGFSTVLIVLFGACASDRLDAARREAAEIARSGGLERRLFEETTFALIGWERAGRSADGTLVVYLEGDGRGWINRGRIAEDPTPFDPIGLRLAVADPAPALLYLARPCQYVEGVAAHNCAPRYWTSARFAPEIVTATEAAIDRAKTEMGARRIELVGYSGGGVLAALVAAERHDVERLVTIAANLDLAAWTRLHAVTPLSESLDPTQFAAALSRIPQVHFVGAADEIVPPAILESYRRALGPKAPLDVIVLPDFTHECCWRDAWPDLLVRARRAGTSGGSIEHARPAFIIGRNS
jgi:dienelactone hydrolase